MPNMTLTKERTSRKNPEGLDPMGTAQIQDRDAIIVESRTRPNTIINAPDVASEDLETGTVNYVSGSHK